MSSHTKWNDWIVARRSYLVIRFTLHAIRHMGTPCLCHLSGRVIIANLIGPRAYLTVLEFRLKIQCMDDRQ